MLYFIKIRAEVFVNTDNEIIGNETEKEITLYRKDNFGRIWLVLRSVKDHATEEIIKKYLEHKYEKEDLIGVKKNFQKQHNKCFKVGLETK